MKMIPHVFVCPIEGCGAELVGKSKEYARRRGAFHYMKKHKFTKVEIEDLDPCIKEAGK